MLRLYDTLCIKFYNLMLLWHQQTCLDLRFESTSTLHQPSTESLKLESSTVFKIQSRLNLPSPKNPAFKNGAATAHPMVLARDHTGNRTLPSSSTCPPSPWGVSILVPLCRTHVVPRIHACFQPHQSSPEVVSGTRQGGPSSLSVRSKMRWGLGVVTPPTSSVTWEQC